MSIVTGAILDKIYNDIFHTSLPELPGTECRGCGKHYADAERLLKHESLCEMAPARQAAPPAPATDEVRASALYLLRLLLIRDNLNQAINVGDGQRLLTTVQLMMPYFYSNGNTKYSLATLELVAMVSFFLTDRERVHLLQGRFINNNGKADGNHPIDLECEHRNRVFKESFSLSRGEVNQKTLDRYSKSQDETTAILDNFEMQFDSERYIHKRKVNEEAYDKDIDLIMKTVGPINIFAHENRKLHSTKLTLRDPLTQLNMCRFQNWLRKRLRVMETYTFLK